MALNLNMTPEQEHAVAQNLAEKFASGDASLVKEAENVVTEFIRKHFVEDSFADIILPPERKGVSDLRKSTTTSKPVMLVEIEPDFPGAIMSAFNTPAKQVTMDLRAVEVPFWRIQSHRVKKESLEMLTNSVSLRDITQDMLLKHISKLIDVDFIDRINQAVGSPGSALAVTGGVHNHIIDAPMSQHELVNTFKIIPSLGIDIGEENGFACKQLLMNVITQHEFYHWFGPASPDISTDIMKNGISVFKDKVFGMDIVSTIKHSLVPRGTIYQFTDQRYIGRSYVLQEPTLRTKQMNHAVEFSIDCVRGSAIFIFGGLAKVHFTMV
jgi:hypothetical protein